MPYRFNVLLDCRRLFSASQLLKSNIRDLSQSSTPWWKSVALRMPVGQEKIVPLVDPHMQTKELPDGSRVCKYLESDELKRRRYEDVTTLYEVVRRGAKVSNNGNMLGQRIKQSDGTSPYVWIRYEDMISRSLSIARAFRKMDLLPGQETFIGIYSRNSPEWIIVEQATYAYSNVLVPLYETFAIEASVFIINQASIQVVVCDTVGKANGLLDKKNECASLKCIVLVAAQIPDDLKEKAVLADVHLFTFGEFEDLGNKNATDDKLYALQPPKSDDLCTICYTSGTTGMPKGVMLTHGNVVADCTTLDYFKYSNIDQGHVMISFLPLAHMFERVTEAALYLEGGSVGFYNGDMNLLADDIKQLRPTVMAVVPRLLNRVYDKVMTEANKYKIGGWVLKVALSLKSNELSNWIVRNDSLVDRIVFKKVRDGLGGRVKLIITGSAPISDEVLTFIRCAVGCFVVEGYGQTECVAACTVTIEGDFVPGHVGVPSPCNAIKLVDAPELNYFAKDQAGEICIKGYNVFRGYYKMPEQTKETLDSDGWLHTGDIGKWTDRGTLKLIDRKKSILKLAQGEYVSPERIEAIYARCKYITQCFVYGESLQSYLVAIIVPNYETLKSDATTELGIDGISSMEQLCSDKNVKKLLLRNLRNLGKAANLAGFEQVKDIFLCSDMFSIDNGLLTPTLKNKRPQLEKLFQKEIAGMYK